MTRLASILIVAAIAACAPIHLTRRRSTAGPDAGQVIVGIGAATRGRPTPVTPLVFPQEGCFRRGKKAASPIHPRTLSSIFREPDYKTDRETGAVVCRVASSG